MLISHNLSRVEGRKQNAYKRVFKIDEFFITLIVGVI
jgi:hypothetical protein